jgi:hypothetical protein
MAIATPDEGAELSTTEPQMSPVGKPEKESIPAAQEVGRSCLTGYTFYHTPVQLAGCSLVG